MPVSATRKTQRPFLVFALFASIFLVYQTMQMVSVRMGLAALVGLLAGLSLYHASFGFTSAWRRFYLDARGSGLRWQIILILGVSLISYPLIAAGGIGDIRAFGMVFPFGVAPAIGAFLFGIGMQWGGGCASGTLFTAGGGNVRMIVTLVFFIAGSLWATEHAQTWQSWPSFKPVSLVKTWGPLPAYAFLLLILGGILLFSLKREKEKHGSLESEQQTWSLLHGPWPKSWGVIGLAIVCIATILVLSRPWGITSAFALWGAKIAIMADVPVGSWYFWRHQGGALERSVLYDATSVMNFGIILGALVAASLAGRIAPSFKMSWKDLITAIIGGLLMGYGARLAWGCNIGAYLGGIISGSLHGWGWLVFGFAGSMSGSWLRTRFLRI